MFAVRRPWLWGFAFLVGPLLVGCGAKTGLLVPDAGEVNVDEVDAGIPCFEVPLDGGPVNVSLDIQAEVGRADVALLIDTTYSMLEEIEAIRDRLRDQIAPAIAAAIPDSQIGVATFADFPVGSYGSAADGDLPFSLMVPTTGDLARVQAAVDAIRLGNGNDTPESQVEALYQLGTGDGIGTWVPPSAGCPSGGKGYPCFRLDALPIVLLFTDAAFHNGPGGANPYAAGEIFPAPHVYDDAVAALQAIDARVIGFDSGDGAATSHLRSIARDTGTLDARGQPLVYDIGTRGTSLGTQVVDAIRTFAGSVVQDIGAAPRDPDPTDGIDVTGFVQDIIPLSANPMSSIERIDVASGLFIGVDAGVVLTFQIVLRNDAVVPGTEPLHILLEVVFRADGSRFLGRRLVELGIPALDGEGCPGP